MVKPRTEILGIMLSDNRYISLEYDPARLMERNRTISTILEFNDFLSGCADREELLTRSLARVLDIFHFDAGRVYLMDESGQFLKLSASQGVDTTGLEVVSLAEGFTGKSARTRSFIAQYVTELEDKDRVSLLTSKGFNIIICVPLITRNILVGVMNLAARKKITLNQEMVDLLITLGNQISVFYENWKLMDSISEKMEKINEQEEGLKFFIYSILHDLRGPTTAVHGLTRKLSAVFAGTLGDKGRAYCEHILKASEQLMDLVEKLNAYVASKEATLSLESLILNDLCEDIRLEFDERMRQQGVKWTIPNQSSQITADRLALTRVLRNLVENALKYGGLDLSEIRIGFLQSKTDYTLTVSDDGVGIKREDAERLFGLFQRNETAKGIEGTGLGLTIVREIVEKHGGRICLASDRPKGATFEITLPRRSG